MKTSIGLRYRVRLLDKLYSRDDDMRQGGSCHACGVSNHCTG